MGIKVKRRYFTKAQKVSILNELSISGLSLLVSSHLHLISVKVLKETVKAVAHHLFTIGIKVNIYTIQTLIQNVKMPVKKVKMLAKGSIPKFYIN